MTRVLSSSRRHPRKFPTKELNYSVNEFRIIDSVLKKIKWTKYNSDTTRHIFVYLFHDGDES